MMQSEVFSKTLDTLHVLSEVYHNISGGPHTSTKPLCQLTDMMALLIDQLSTHAQGQVG